MRKLIFLGLVLTLGACESGGFSISQNFGSDECNARSQRGLIGGPIEDMAAVSAAAPKVRFIRPGDAVTMDEQPDRLNIRLDENGNVQEVYCG
jgi:hypothetical protein